MGRSGSPIETLNFQSRTTEVHQEPDVDGGRLQAVDDLGLVFGGERPDGLDLQQNAPIDEKVGREGADIATSKRHADQGFALSLQSVFVQRDDEGRVVHAFEESGAELVTDVDAYADDSSGQCLMMKAS